MSVKLTLQSKLTAEETLTLPSAAGNQSKVTHSVFDTALTLDGSSAPAVTNMAAFEQALTAGAAAIDLTSLTGTQGIVDGSGLKVQAIKFQNPAGNGAMTIGEGVTNGYELMGNGWTLDLLAGQEITFYGNEATPDIGATAKAIDISGTGTEKLNIIVIMG